MKPITSLFAILISSLAILKITDAAIEYADSDRPHQPKWFSDPHRNRIEIFKKWLGGKPGHSASNERSASPYDILHPVHQFKGTYYHCLFSHETIFNFQ